MCEKTKERKFKGERRMHEFIQHTKHTHTKTCCCCETTRARQQRPAEKREAMLMLMKMTPTTPPSVCLTKSAEN